MISIENYFVIILITKLITQFFKLIYQLYIWFKLKYVLIY